MLDEKSLEILKILQEKARIPNVDISRQVGLAPSAVLERIRKLEKQGYIDGYEVRLNPERFGKSLIAFIQVKVDFTVEQENLGSNFSDIPEVQEVHFISGDDSYLIKLRVADQKELASIIQTRIANQTGVIATKTSTVLTTHKETARIPICQRLHKE